MNLEKVVENIEFYKNRAIKEKVEFRKILEELRDRYVKQYEEMTGKKYKSK